MTPPGRPRALVHVWSLHHLGSADIYKRLQALISSRNLPRRRRGFFCFVLFLRNEKKNEAPAGGTWSEYPGIVDTKTLRDQATTTSDSLGPDLPSFQ